MGATEIQAGVRIEGTITGSSDVNIFGEVKGQIDTNSTVVIASGGAVEADIEAVNVVIDGDFRGNIVAVECIKVTPNARATGQLKAPAIAIERGALFSGGIEMTDNPLNEEKEVKAEKQNSQPTPKPAPKPAPPKATKPTPAPAKDEPKEEPKEELEDEVDLDTEDEVQEEKKQTAVVIA